MSSTAAAQYPCPACRAPASLATGCPGCARAPDPLAAEVIRLDGEIAGLAARAEQARMAWVTFDGQLRAAQTRRHQLVVQLQAAVRANTAAAPRPVVPAFSPTPGPRPTPGPAAQPVRAEASTRTVQNLLFVLGGLLLGTAAVVFTAVAWASVGAAGRAAILAGVTAVLLALPPLANWRGLRGTAETFAALGLLLVLLDGYAARYVDLFDVGDLPAARYAAATFAVTGLVAAGYHLLTGLTAARFVALLAAQPVLPLLAVDVRADTAGWTLLLLGTAATTLAMIALTPRERPAVRITGWVLVGFTLTTAAITALAALVLQQPPNAAALSGVPLLTVALVAVAAARLSGRRALLAISLAGLAPTLALAVIRAAAEPVPSLTMFFAALTTVALAALGVLARRQLPDVVRTGPWAGALLVATVLGSALLTAALAVGAAGVRAARPLWHAGPGPVDAPGDWQLPFAVVAVTAALTLLLPRAGRPALLTVGAATLLLTVPAAAPVPWWAVTAAGLVAGAASTVRAAGSRDLAVAAPSGAVAVVLTGHALLVSAGRPVTATIACAFVIACGLAAAAVARRVGGRPDAGWWHPVVGGTALAVAVAGWAVTAALAAYSLGLPTGWPARAALAAVTLLPVALLAVRRWWPGYLWYVGPALAAATVGAILAPASGAIPYAPGESAGGYAAWGALLLAGTAALVPAGVLRIRVPDRALRLDRVSLRGLRILLAGVAGLLIVPATVTVLPALWTILLTPYLWVDAAWTGVPAGAGLTPALPPSLPAAAVVTLAVLSAASAVLGRLIRRVVLAAAPVALLGLLVALAAGGTPWPVVPALTLAAGLGGLAVAARTGSAAVVAVTLALGVPLTGAGLAGLLPTRASTLAALTVLVAVAAWIGVTGHRQPVRVAGWVAAVAAGTVLALTGSRVAEAPVRVGAFAVLAVAALALATGVLLTTRTASGARWRAESIGVEVAGHVAAVAAVLMTVGSARYAAGICTLWGAVLGTRALLTTRWTAPVGTGSAPGRPLVHRPLVHRPWPLAIAALVSEIVAWWLLLAATEVSLTEAYTLPVALAALGVGWLALRARPQRSSWIGYGPGLAAALLPSLGSVLVADGQPLRRLLLGTGAVLVVLAGSAYRRQAPVVVGGVVLAVLALRELVAVWDLFPRWGYLAVGGLALITLAVTYERRRRDLGRLRSAVSRMS
ncbi:SCO7613 C-terminal domain-containing membrane protein [Micromonospora sp. LOL_023]|uniref:SCO7613 C-terminal domain-containing membrane protein n=1 Tax=Micromonospora sp. LOL_023 TaxID=3345418 RepID=UPI003A87B4F5